MPGVYAIYKIFIKTALSVALSFMHENSHTILSLATPLRLYNDYNMQYIFHLKY